MRIDLNIQKRKHFRISPILFRRIHKWVGLVLGIQFVLWTVSGATMALLDMEKVGGHSAAPASVAAAPWPQDIAAPKIAGPVDGLTLRRILDRPIYELRGQGGLRLLDARSGEPIVIDKNLAARLARSAYHHDAPVRSVTYLEEPNIEARDFSGPMWRVDFANEDNSSSYISAETGLPLVDRSDTWRVWDFFWMLHNMDYVNRTSFNHPLIIFAGFSALWLSLTGFYLLFKSFRRREFRWIIGRGKP
ncbi:PepSY domain-containing protein [Sphingosinicella humi]|uniref:PepSY domain-containing protein n=1 Tax=Allosphingosinicella humi TaxID=2068657 RepID=A0A2U2J0W3_9SPHN|nr:PepSY domain-containing protein [Sphingosinicella humi]PWG01980.1 hypothetical protein DF286_03195 [Sphingosinicella humi]